MPHKILFVFATLKEAESFLSKKIRVSQGELYRLNASNWILVTGISILNSILFLSLTIPKIKPCLVVNLGIAGTFSPSIYSLGSTVICKTEIWPELGIYTPAGVNRKLLKFPLWDTIDNKIDLNPTKILHKFQLNLSLPKVTSLTVSGVSGFEKQAQTLKKAFQADIENMEGFALAYACYILKVPFLEIRTISNVVGVKDKKFWDIAKALSSLAKLKEYFL